MLRIQVQAGGVAGARLAPREAFVTRMLRRESAGIYVLLFMPADDAAAALAGQGACEWGEGARVPVVVARARTAGAICGVEG